MSPVHHHISTSRPKCSSGKHILSYFTSLAVASPTPSRKLWVKWREEAKTEGNCDSVSCLVCQFYMLCCFGCSLIQRLANPSPPKVLGNLRVVLNLRQALSLGNLTWPTHLLLIYQVQVGWVLATWDNLISAAPLHRLPYELHQAGSGAPVKPLSRIILWTPGFPNFHVAHILKIPQISQIHEAGISAFLQRAWLLVASHILRTVLHFRLRGLLSAPVESEPPSGPHFFGSSLAPHWSTI